MLTGDKPRFLFEGLHKEFSERLKEFSDLSNLFKKIVQLSDVLLILIFRIKNGH